MWEELRQRDQRRKLTTMHKLFQMKDDIDMQYMSRKEGKLLISIDDCERCCNLIGLVWFGFMEYQTLSVI